MRGTRLLPGRSHLQAELAGHFGTVACVLTVVRIVQPALGGLTAAKGGGDGSAPRAGPHYELVGDWLAHERDTCMGRNLVQAKSCTPRKDGGTSQRAGNVR